MASRPRNIVPLIAPHEMAAFAAAPTAHLTNHGGPILTSVQLQAVFWGTAWQQAPQSTLIAQLGSFFTFILQSSLMDLLAEYGPIGHGQYLGAVNVTTPAIGTTVSDAQIQQALQGWIQGQLVTQPTANTLYFVYLPPGVVSTNGAESSCTQYCGYHNHINGQIFYALEPYIICAGCQFGTGIFDSLTKVSTHELCEAITDPALSAWFDDNTGDEIGDICNGNVTTLGGFVVQTEWSNSQNACLLAAPPPPQPPGSVTTVVK
jgi:hypothetical protein